MSLHIYNTLHRRKEPFEPLEPGRVRMYVCGVTVYDESHVGHARSFIVFDVIYRYLLQLGYRVDYIRNFTDVDDKIIQRSRDDGTPWDQISRTYIKAFHRDMDALGLRRPTREPKATEHIADMIRAIRALESKGLAYAVDGNVYFSVSRIPSYGQLSHQNREQMLSGARVEVDERKRDPLDFALWKRSREGEPAWESPWGKGRPGWHIECTCMSQRYLGDTLDIHGGGLDLVFPHHENEIAQSEGLTGKPFVRHWIHNGPLTRDGVKMSKSLGNILTIQEALEEYHPEELRLFFLMSHYRSPQDLSQKGLSEACSALDRLYSGLQRLNRLASQTSTGQTRPAKSAPTGGPARVTVEQIRSFEKAFHRAMDDDFNTPQALANLFHLNRLINQWLDHPSFCPTAEAIDALDEAKRCYGLCDSVMGILSREPGAFFKEKEDRFLAKRGLDRAQIQSLIDRRSEARTHRDWKTADRIREELLEHGIQILDTPEGTTWKVGRRPSDP